MNNEKIYEVVRSLDALKASLLALLDKESTTTQNTEEEAAAAAATLLPSPKTFSARLVAREYLTRIGYEPLSKDIICNEFINTQTGVVATIVADDPRAWESTYTVTFN